MDVFDILTEQHRELEERLEALEAEEGEGTAEARPEAELREDTEALVTLLRLHSQLEERHLYPLLARVEGRSRSSLEAEDHLTMRDLVEELEEATPGEPEWLACLTALEDLVIAHVREEEAEVFPRLATVMDAREQEDFRRALRATREELLALLHRPRGGEALLEEPRWEA